jgi:hypothetical protein
LIRILIKIRITPLAPLEGGSPSPIPLRLRKRYRPQTTLEEDLVAARDQVRNDRSKALHDHLRRSGNLPLDEQLEWLRGRFTCSPEEAADIAAIVEHAQLKVGEARYAR